MSVRLQLGDGVARLDSQSPQLLAGRDPTSCRLAHADETLSRQHAELRLTNGMISIRDLGSANGTWIDGENVGHSPVLLHPGQRVWLGHVSLGVTWETDGRKTVVAREPPAALRSLIKAHQLRSVPGANVVAIKAPARGGVGAGVASLVLGIIGLVGSLVPCLGAYALPLTLLAIIFGLAGFNSAGTGMAITGFILGLIGSAIAGWWLYLVFEAKHAIDKGIETYDQQHRVAPLREEPSGPRCTVGGRVGVCIDVSECTGVATPGFCVGADSIRCCTAQ